MMYTKWLIQIVSNYDPVTNPIFFPSSFIVYSNVSTPVRCILMTTINIKTSATMIRITTYTRSMIPIIHCHNNITSASFF